MKYIIKFKKTGVISFTSHLDIMKVFKRAFKRAGISLAFSQGFNPHPKIGFAQPLSLGYESMEEFIEFETAEDYDEKNGQEIMESLKAIMPKGLELISFRKAPELKKSLAAETVSARYIIDIPTGVELAYSSKEIYDKYIGQPEILALKKQKKKKEMIEIDIKPKIREIDFAINPGHVEIDTLIDSGSESNLSPELIITSFLKTFNLDTSRNEIDVTRLQINFRKQ